MQEENALGCCSPSLGVVTFSPLRPMAPPQGFPPQLCPEGPGKIAGVKTHLNGSNNLILRHFQKSSVACIGVHNIWTPANKQMAINVNHC